MKRRRLMAMGGLAAGAIMVIIVAATTGAAAELAAQDHVRRALATSEELLGKAESPSSDELRQVQPRACVLEDTANTPSKAFARQSQVELYTRDRSWCWAYPHIFWSQHAVPAIQWPRESDAPALRALLDDKDAAIRSLAVEALVTLHQTEDIPRIGRMLDDEAQGAPVLGFSMQHTAIAFSQGSLDARLPAQNADPLVLLRTWHTRQVRTYAREGLYLMTHQRFADSGEFDKWWKTHRNARECLWYWQRRLQLDVERSYMEHHPDRDPQRPGETWDVYQNRIAKAPRHNNLIIFCGQVGRNNSIRHETRQAED